MTTTAQRLHDTNRMLAPGQRSTPESYEAYCKDNAYWNDLDEASTANGLADATVPASQVLPECVRDATTGEVYSASPGHLVTVAAIVLDNASQLAVHLPWLQTDQMAARTVDGVPRHLPREDVTPQMCTAALRQHVALANGRQIGLNEGIATGQSQAHTVGSAAGRTVVNQSTSSASDGTAPATDTRHMFDNQAWDPNQYPTRFDEHENQTKERHKGFLNMLRAFPEQRQAFRTLHDLITTPLDGDNTIVPPLLPRVDVDVQNYHHFGQTSRCKSRLGIQSGRIIHTVDLLVEKGDNAEEARLGEGNVKDHSDHHQVLHVPKLHVSSRCQHAQCHKLFQQSSGRGARRGFGCMGGNIGSLESFPKLRGVTITTTCRLGRRTNWSRPCRIVESVQQQGDLLRALRPKR